MNVLVEEITALLSGFDQLSRNLLLVILLYRNRQVALLGASNKVIHGPTAARRENEGDGVRGGGEQKNEAVDQRLAEGVEEKAVGGDDDVDGMSKVGGVSGDGVPTEQARRERRRR